MRCKWRFSHYDDDGNHKIIVMICIWIDDQIRNRFFRRWWWSFDSTRFDHSYGNNEPFERGVSWTRLGWACSIFLHLFCWHTKMPLNDLNSFGILTLFGVLKTVSFISLNMSRKSYEILPSTWLRPAKLSSIWMFGYKMKCDKSNA